MAGFIKIYRDVLDTVLFQKPVLLQMWLFLNKQARFVKTVRDGIEILPGQVLTSATELAECVKLTERRVRYILDCLEEMELIRRENIRNRYTLITLTNPDELRDIRQPKQTAAAATQPQEEQKPQETPKPQEAPKPQQEQKKCFGVCLNVYLTAEEKQLLQKRSNAVDSYIDRLSAYKRRTGKDYNDDFAVLCEWITKDEIAGVAQKSSAAPKQAAQAPSKPTLSHYQGVCTDFFHSPASYDLERAEMIARTSVPTRTKRPKRENEKIGLP